MCNTDLRNHKINCLCCNWAVSGIYMTTKFTVWATSAFYDLQPQTNTVSNFSTIAFYHLPITKNKHALSLVPSEWLNYGAQTQYWQESIKFDKSLWLPLSALHQSFGLVSKF